MTSSIDIAIFPPFPYLLPALEGTGGRSILLGAQDVYHEENGAYTGEVSAQMLIDCSCDAVLVGHSERRHVIGESDDLVNRKVRAALDAGLWVVLCIGETLDERERGETDAVNLRQLRAGLLDVPIEQAARQVIVAYEPVWAIGTGRNASASDAQAAHEVIRREIVSLYDAETAKAIRIIYGGSVKPSNAAELVAEEDVDGFLVGGASLVAGDFIAIARSALPSGEPRVKTDSKG
jgi:triosephosphate isomerase